LRIEKNNKINRFQTSGLSLQSSDLNPQFKKGTTLKAENWRPKTGFTLVELMIVVSILGILAAIVLPEFQGHVQQAKEAAAKDNLRILRETIERYAVDYNGVAPGYQSGNPANLPTQSALRFQLLQRNYLNEIPKNPFNNMNTVLMIANDVSFPTTGTGEYGWVYQPQTKKIKLDWPGTDSNGILYWNY
jgi:general secretion pathway protein G